MANQLAAEKSPYLRQHADNPVDWHPWGAAVFARAKAEQKPVFLSIGYSTCHWCHVMAHESFESAAVAALLNAHFISVKVDREERPDIDRIYMTYVQHTTGHGGWPISVWLTPDGKPFFGGTYFPVNDQPGRPGFVTLLRAVSRHWREQREKIISGADEVVSALQQLTGGGGTDENTGESESLPEAATRAFESGWQYFTENHDARWGGFGGAPKFPRAPVINFLFRNAAWYGAQSERGAAAVKTAARTLQRMAEGGLHDHVGGGFHRYSVDERWHVPHFEKMLYDQAQIALNYLEARQATGREVYAWIARGILDYVRRDLTGPHGEFYSAEDADSLVQQGSPEHAEGAFYVWTKAEVDVVLEGDAPFFCAHFGVRPGGNVAPDPQAEFRGKNVLMQQQALADTAREFELEIEAADNRLQDCLEKLRIMRAQRSRPLRDDKVITAWNGLMISALAKGSQVLGELSCLAEATRAAEFVERELYDGTAGTLYRSWRQGRGDIGGFAEDYAFLIQALLDLYEAGFELRWLQWAVKLQAGMDRLFWDDKHGGYFNSRADDATVIVRLKEDYDGAEPAANSIAAANLLRFDWMLGLTGARDRALRVFTALRHQWSGAPHALPQMLSALEMAIAEPRTVVLAGDPTAGDLRALALVLSERLGPRRAVLCVEGGEGQAWLAARLPYLAQIKPLGGRATAYVCENFACRPPVTEAGDLRRLLR